MKIKKIKINFFGKINDKEINLKKINIIYGKNESGKSTLLNYIVSMFYGISKNKNGKSQSDYDRYMPWNSNDFSGRVEYELDNNQEYSVYRDFTKKSPEIYDVNGNDISHKFNIDKKLGNTFFYDQIKIDRDTMMSTVITSQNETEVDSNEQNLLIQKVANLADSGDEDVSYKKAVAKLDKLLLNEVGTSKSQDRPINVARENIDKYKSELEELKDAQDVKYELEEKKNKLRKDLEVQEQNSKIYQEISVILQDSKNKEEMINFKKNILEENTRNIDKYNKEKDGMKKKTHNKLNFIILGIIVLINIISLIFIRKPIINAIIATLIPIWAIVILLKNKSNNSKNLSLQIELLSKNNNEISAEIAQMSNELDKYKEMQINELTKRYGDIIRNLYNDKYIERTIEDSKRLIEKLNLELHKIELDMEYIEPKLDKILELEEKLAIEEANLEVLTNKSKAYGIARELIETSYNEMKNSITPKFNENLSKNVDKLSNGKYKKILLNEGIQIELDNGRYVPIDKLSMGTIQQIYLAFRLSFMDSLSQEKLPILLDETFAYYDKERLKSSLEFLSNIENQVIIFTCTEREKEILDGLKIDYNFVEL